MTLRSHMSYCTDRPRKDATSFPFNDDDDATIGKIVVLLTEKKVRERGGNKTGCLAGMIKLVVEKISNHEGVVNKKRWGRGEESDF